jgi:thioester reductase-like protein
LFHNFGLLIRSVPVLPPPEKPVTADLCNEIINSGLVDRAFLPPSIIDDISLVPEYAENLRKLHFIIYAGAPLSTVVGDSICDKTRLVNVYGQTETGLTHQYLPDPEDYAYVGLGALSNFEFQHQSGDLYEPVMVRKQGLEKYQAGLIIDKTTALHTNDLFSRHPDPNKSDFWLHRGRADNIIVFENGEKINPTSMEELIETHPQVKSALVVGEGRFQSALLVEPVPDVESPEATAELLESIWPVVEEANKDCPAHGRVDKSHVLFARPGLPFPRTGKGTVRRSLTTQLYKEDINETYDAANGIATVSHITINGSDSLETLLHKLRELVRTTTDLGLKDDDDNFYQLGMDSLQTLQLSRSLRASLKDSSSPIDRITPSLVYSHPTMRTLSEGIYELFHNQNRETKPKSDLDEMKAVLREFAEGLPSEKKVNGGSMGTRRVAILLTGSTGSFGSYLLHYFLQQPLVDHVYCVNRATDGRSRQVSSNTARGLEAVFDRSRVSFYTADFSQPFFGLEKATYDGLLNRVTHVVHNAWTVNFNLSLSTFARTNLEGVRSFIRFSLDSAHRSQVFFVSSIGAVAGWTRAGRQGPVPEEIINDPRTAEKQGYAHSKWISEQLLDLAHKKLDVPICILRVGQIAGPIGTTKGSWNTTEWFPLFLKGCKSIGMLPKVLPFSNLIDWLPVNVLAEGTVELVLEGCDGKGSLVYNLANPNHTTWAELRAVVHRALSGSDGAQIKLVDYAEWIQGLEVLAEETTTKEGMRDNPVVKLLEFWKAVTVQAEDEKRFIMSTDNATQNSKVLRTCGPVTAEWIALWVSQLGLAASSG